MKSFAIRSTLLLALAVASGSCADRNPCRIPEQWKTLLDRKPSPHAIVVVRIDIEDGEVLKWNGRRATPEVVNERLRAIAGDFPAPFLAITLNKQACSSADRPLEDIYKLYPCRDGLCGLQIVK